MRRGTPPTNSKVSLPLVEPIGMLLMLEPSASEMSEMSDAFSALDAGMKCSPWTWSEAGLFGSPDPARKSGSWPGPKMKRSEMRSRRLCACAEVTAPTTRSDAMATARGMARRRAAGEDMPGRAEGTTTAS